MLNQYFTTKFLFNINRVMLEKPDKVLLGIGLVLVIFAIVFKLAEMFSPTPTDKKFRRKLFNLFLTIGILEAVWFGARYQNVRFFGTHFVGLLILLIGLIWLGFVVVDMVKNYSKEKDQWEKDQVKLKYLPK